MKIMPLRNGVDSVNNDADSLFTEPPPCLLETIFVTRKHSLLFPISQTKMALLVCFGTMVNSKCLSAPIGIIPGHICVFEA